MIKDIEEYPWSEELQCRYMSWIAEDITTLILRTPDEYNKCDMAGCIRIAKKIMPEVTKIVVFEGSRKGAVYTKKGIKWNSGIQI
ncbi:MAG: hypothetical protein ACO3E4_07660 [Candidatus Nanopelagicaceae bacterium]|jgi:hypothetical protein